MKLERIFLQNYANYEREDFSSEEMLNVITGENAQGKTNLLDAIYYLSRGRSGRYQKDQEIIQWGKEFFRIRAKVVSYGVKRNITVSYHKGKKAIEVDGNTLDRNSRLLGIFNTVLFSPDDLYLVKGGPEKRRRYLDDELIQTDRSYYEELIKYRKILVQRNNLLKQIRKGCSKTEMLDVLDIQMSEIGTFLTNKRMNMLEKLKPLARLTGRKITDHSEDMEIGYLCSSRKNNNSESSEINADEFLESLQKMREDEIEKGFSCCGPHRDDFSITINGTDVKTYGSQGQQRTAALCLKIAEIEFLKALTGEYPVLLLDDVLSELDQKRKAKLLEIVSENIQTYITCTETGELDNRISEKASIRIIKNGTIVSGSG